MQRARAVAHASNRFVVLAVAFYAGLAGIAWLWRCWWLGRPLLRPESAVASFTVLEAVAAGLATGLLLVAISRWWTRVSRVGTALAQALREALPPLAVWQVVVLAAVSGFGEEALFRGALQPALGWWLATLLFGAAHFIPRRPLWWWAPLAALAGGIFGALYLWTGQLWAAVTAHAVVNAINLHWLSGPQSGLPASGRIDVASQD